MIKQGKYYKNGELHCFKTLVVIRAINFFFVFFILEVIFIRFFFECQQIKNKHYTLLSFIYSLHFLVKIRTALYSTLSKSPISMTRNIFMNPIFESVDVQKEIVFSEVIPYEGEIEKLLLDDYTPAG